MRIVRVLSAIGCVLVAGASTGCSVRFDRDPRPAPEMDLGPDENADDTFAANDEGDVPSTRGGRRGRRERTGNERDSGDRGKRRPVDRRADVELGIAPLETAGLEREIDAAANAPCHQGPAGEATHADYRDTQNRGTARALRGRVGIVVVGLHPPNGGAPKASPKPARALAVAVAGAQKALVRESKRYDANVAIDLYYWDVPAAVGARGIDPTDQARVEALANDVAARVHAATGHGLSDAIRFLDGRGYRERAVVVQTPALVAGAGAAFNTGWNGVDLALMNTSTGPAGASLFAHELLHLFGADDLYDMAHFDARDRGDVMANGPSGVCVRDATAWAIGWRPQRPARTYFGDRSADRSSTSSNEDGFGGGAGVDDSGAEGFDDDLEGRDAQDDDGAAPWGTSPMPWGTSPMPWGTSPMPWGTSPMPWGSSRAPWGSSPSPRGLVRVLRR